MTRNRCKVEFNYSEDYSIFFFTFSFSVNLKILYFTNLHIIPGAWERYEFLFCFSVPFLSPSLFIRRERVGVVPNQPSHFTCARILFWPQNIIRLTELWLWLCKSLSHGKNGKSYRLVYGCLIPPRQDQERDLRTVVKQPLNAMVSSFSKYKV